MDQQRLAHLRQLAATIRLSTHILEQYPEQLYNQIAGRIGNVSYLEMRPPRQVYMRLESRSLKQPDQAIMRILVGHRDRVLNCAFSPDGRLVVSASADKTLRLWNVQTGDCVRVLSDHSSPVTACTFSPDGHYILSASEDATLRLWDSSSGRIVQIFRGHTQTINACCFHPDGIHVLSASGGNEWQQTEPETDNSLRLWNSQTGECEYIFEFPDELHNRICSCTFSSDGRFSLSGDGDGKVRLWNMEIRKCIQTRWEGTDYVLDCAFIPDNKALRPLVRRNFLALCASADHTLRIWEIGEHSALSGTEDSLQREIFQDPLEKTLKALNGHQDDVTGCVIIFNQQHPDKLYAISSSHDHTLRLWDVVSGESLHVLEGHTGWVNGCATSPAGKIAASASSDNSVILWDIGALLSASTDSNRSVERESWRSIRAFTGHEKGVDGCAFSPDGKYILSSSSWFTLQLWDCVTGETGRSFYRRSWVRCCACSPDGKYVLGGYADGTLVLWDIQTGREVRVFPGHEGDVWRCAFSPDSKRILSASLDKTSRYWNVETGACIRTLQGHDESVDACAISPDGRLGLSGSRDWTLRLWDLETGECLHVLEKERSGQFRGLLEVNDCAFIPNPRGQDAKYAISASDDHTVSLWDVESGRLVRTYTGHAEAVTGCAFSPDGHFIASTSRDKAVRLWDVETATCICTFRGHTDTVYTCAFSPDGKYLLSESGDQTLRLWDVLPYQGSPPVEGHQLPVRACRFSPDGRYALSASEDLTLRLWDVVTWRVRRIFTGHTEPINDCAISPDSRHALSASDDCTLRLWDVQSGACLKTFTGHEEKVWGCAFTPDCRHILSGSGDRRVALWDIATEQPITTFTNKTQNLTRYMFTPDGRYIVATSAVRSLWLWDVSRAEQIPSYEQIVGPTFDEETQRFRTVFPGPNIVSAGDTVAISPDGRLALSTCSGGILILWVIASGREVLRCKNPTGFYISSISFSPTGRYLLGKTGDHLLQVWDAATGEVLAHWPADMQILSCAFHPDGQHILAGDSSGAVHFLLLEGATYWKVPPLAVWSLP